MLALNQALEPFKAATSASIHNYIQTLLNADSKLRNKDAVDASVAAVRLAFDATISRELQMINARGSVHGTRVPDEIWSLVWEKLSFSDLIAVTHVCKEWRDRSLAMPQIWSSIDLKSSLHCHRCTCVHCREYAYSYEDDFETVLRRRPLDKKRIGSFTNLKALQTALDRSKSAPLNLYIDYATRIWYEPYCGEAEASPDYLPLTQYCDVLLPHTSRIRSLTIIHESRDFDLVEFFFDSVGPLPMLQFFICTFVNTAMGEDDELEYPPPVPYFTASALSHVPALRVLKISPTAVRFKLHGTGRPMEPTTLGSLTSISLSLVTYLEIYQLFSGCPTIIDAEVSLFAFQCNSSAAPSPLVLPNLQHLRLTDVPHELQWSRKSSLRDLFAAGTTARAFHLDFEDYHEGTLIPGELPTAILRQSHFGDVSPSTELAFNIIIGPTGRRFTIAAEDITPGIQLLANAEPVAWRRQVSLWRCEKTDCDLLNNLWANIDPTLVVRLRLTFSDASAEWAPFVGSVFPNVHDLIVCIPQILCGDCITTLIRKLGFTNWKSAFPRVKHVHLMQPQDYGKERRLAGGLDELTKLILSSSVTT